VLFQVRSAVGAFGRRQRTQNPAETMALLRRIFFLGLVGSFGMLTGCPSAPVAHTPPLIKGTVTLADGRNVNGVIIVFKFKSKRTFAGLVKDGQVEVEPTESGYADIYFKVPEYPPIAARVEETPEEKQQREEANEKRKAEAALVTRDIPSKYLDPDNPNLGIMIEPKGETPLYIKLK
jgi:hypothetical protein